MTTSKRASAPVTTFVVEAYWPSGVAGSFQDATARLDARLANLRREGLALRAVAATLVPGDEAAYWVVDGPSAEVVARACAEAELPVERIVDAVELRARHRRGRTTR